MTVSTSAWYPLVRNLSACSTRFGVLTSPSRAGFSPSSASKRLIRSCIVLLYICASASHAVGQSADALYANRADSTSARRAADLWSAAVAANPRDFESARKLARASYWLGDPAPVSERRGCYEKGIEAGQRAIAIDPARPDGHF